MGDLGRVLPRFWREVAPLAEGTKLMEIIATLVGQGFTQDMYERLRQGVNWDGDPVDGWLAHAVYWDESGGIHITNMWVSIEHMQTAFATRLGPVMRSIGIPPPHGEVHETFNLSVF